MVCICWMVRYMHICWFLCMDCDQFHFTILWKQSYHSLRYKMWKASTLLSIFNKVAFVLVSVFMYSKVSLFSCNFTRYNKNINLCTVQKLYKTDSFAFLLYLKRKSDRVQNLCLCRNVCSPTVNKYNCRPQNFLTL